jgi:hypothetical protein
MHGPKREFIFVVSYVMRHFRKILLQETTISHYLEISHFVILFYNAFKEIETIAYKAIQAFWA